MILNRRAKLRAKRGLALVGLSMFWGLVLASGFIVLGYWLGGAIQ